MNKLKIRILVSNYDINLPDKPDFWTVFINVEEIINEFKLVITPRIL